MTDQIKDLVKDPVWQKVRESLLGKWNKTPDWCCQQLKNYIGSIQAASAEKLLIVQNYLSGTGFRTGIIKHNCSTNLKVQIKVELVKRRMKGK